jgi:hypothetical protein
VVAQISRGHRTVPKFYLDGFANDDQKIGVVRLPGNTRYPQSTKDVSVITDFYNIDDRADPNAVEKLVSEIEGDAARVFRKVLVGGHWPLDDNERSILATFFGLQNVRGPNQRQALGEIAAAIATAQGHEQVANSSGADDRANEVKHVHIASMLDIKAYGQYYFGRCWMLIPFNRKDLLTCDTPVSLLPNPAAPHAAVGIGNAWAILFPMCRTVGMIMFRVLPGEQRTDATADGSTYLAGVFNDAAINNARQCIFHHPDDASLIPSELPEPSSAEVSTDHPE